MKTILTLLTSVLAFVLINLPICAQVTLEWAVNYANGSGENGDYARCIAVDDSGNIYVSGTSENSGTSADIATVKYNPSGSQLWLNRYNGSANSYDEARSIAIDGLGNIYVVGSINNSGTGIDFSIIKYGPAGNQIWIRNYNGPGNSTDGASSLCFDSQNNVYVTGYSFGIGTDYDYATLKYSPNGGLQWSRRYNGPDSASDAARSISIDFLGNVYVTGESTGIGTGTRDYATIKYNSNGDSLWVKRYNGTGNGDDQAKSIDVDALGNIYVSGYSVGSGSGNDYVTIKYNTSGDSLWVKRYNGTANQSDVVRSMKVDYWGNVHVTGISVGSSTGNDYVTIKYSTIGDSLWVKRYNFGDDQAECMVMDNVGGVYVSGYSSNDYATVKYSSDGSLMWIQRYNRRPNDHAYAIAIDSLRNVYVTGDTYQDILRRSDYTTIKLSQQVKVTALLEGLYDPVSQQTLRDTLKGYLRFVADPDLIADSSYYFVQSTGVAYFRFHKAVYGQYYLQIKHRNSIETWSVVTYPFLTMEFDFTTAASQAYGNNQILKGTKYCIYSGDVNQDGAIEATDLMIVDNAAFLGLGGYIPPDVNGDYFVDGSDLQVVDNNSTRFIGIVRP
jgi:uncharacterized delta-60 repeat protein